MGSTGSGMFGTYSGDGAGANSRDITGSGDQCPRVIENINLDDVAISYFFDKYKKVPEVRKEVEVYGQLINRRLVVILSDTKEVIGNLPVRYNNLNLCIKKGIEYCGNIISSGVVPIPYIVVNLYVK